MNIKDCALIKPLSCTREQPIVEVAKILKDNKQRRVIVVDENQAPIGIISTTDMSNRVVAENRDLSQTVAGDVMSSPIFVVADIDDDVCELYKRMVDHKSFFVPITIDGKLHGILRYAELLRKTKACMVSHK